MEHIQTPGNHDTRIPVATASRVKEEILGDRPEVVSKTPTPNSKGPALLLMSFPYVSVLELLTVLPERHVTDQLITRFFQSKEPVWGESTWAP